MTKSIFKKSLKVGYNLTITSVCKNVVIIQRTVCKKETKTKRQQQEHDKKKYMQTESYIVYSELAPVTRDAACPKHQWNTLFALH